MFFQNIRFSGMGKITRQLFLVSFLFVIINSAAAESYERTWALYSRGFYEEAYKEIERSTGPLSQSSLWLLGEMHFLGRGTKADLNLGRKFIQQASLKSLSSKHANLPSGLKLICSSSNTLCSDVLKSKASVAPFAQFLDKKRRCLGLMDVSDLPYSPSLFFIIIMIDFSLPPAKCSL